MLVLENVEMLDRFLLLFGVCVAPLHIEMCVATEFWEGADETDQLNVGRVGRTQKTEDDEWKMKI